MADLFGFHSELPAAQAKKETSTRKMRVANLPHIQIPPPRTQIPPTKPLSRPPPPTQVLKQSLLSAAMSQKSLPSVMLSQKSLPSVMMPQKSLPSVIVPQKSLPSVMMPQKPVSSVMMPQKSLPPTIRSKPMDDSRWKQLEQDQQDLADLLCQFMKKQTTACGTNMQAEVQLLQQQIKQMNEDQARQKNLVEELSTIRQRLYHTLADAQRQMSSLQQLSMGGSTSIVDSDWQEAFLSHMPREGNKSSDGVAWAWATVYTDILPYYENVDRIDVASGHYQNNERIVVLATTTEQDSGVWLQTRWKEKLYWIRSFDKNGRPLIGAYSLYP